MNGSIHSVAVFCGSRTGANPAFEAAARALGRGLAASGLRLIYGGGKLGLMGVLADAVLAEGGQVRGVIPEFLVGWEVAHPGVTDMIVTTSMHARKQRMAEEADAFVTMPGGLGTMDETIEILTWRILRLHTKPILLCDVEGSAAPCRAMIEASIEQGFAAPGVRDAFEVVDGVPALLDRLRRLPSGSAGPVDRL
jgi:uncharacterized protein (TIGR00730 family)